MARKPGDWDCPECGALNFASREACFKCEKAAGKGGGERRPGDWDCPECGALVFASRETCFKCDKASGKAAGKAAGKQRRPGDWDCPECGVLNFASRESCFQCDKQTASKGSGAVASTNGVAKASDAIKALAKISPNFKKAWIAYCKIYGQGPGHTDPSKYEDASIVQFADYVAELLQSGLQGAEANADDDTALPQEKPASITKPETVSKKRAPGIPESNIEPNAKASKSVDTPPTEAKKITMKKAVADEIRRLNATGSLMVPIRPGAVASALAALDQASALEILRILEEQSESTEDPNVFVREQAALMS